VRRLLLVHRGSPPGQAGGSEVYVAALAREMARHVEVTLLQPAPSATFVGGFESLRVDGLTTISLVPGASGFESYRDRVQTEAAARVLDHVSPDVVHVHHLAGLPAGMVHAARDRGIPVVITLHDFWAVCPLGQLLNRQLAVCPGPEPVRCLACVGEQVAAPPGLSRAGRTALPHAAQEVLGNVARRASQATHRGAGRVERRHREMHAVLAAADLLLSPSHFLARRLAGLGLPGVRVLPNGRPPFRALPRVPDASGRVRFGFVGSVIPSKGVHVLAEAFRGLDPARARLSIHGPVVPYHGDAGYAERLTGLLGERAPGVLRGPFPHEHLPEILAGLDVLVVPSLWEENAPLTVQEAFASGTPVVVSGHGGLAEMVQEGAGGLRFVPGDTASLRTVLQRFLDEPGLGRVLAQAAPTVPSLAEHASQLRSWYAEAASLRKARAGRVGVVILHAGGPANVTRAATSAVDPALRAQVLVVENGPAAMPAALPEGVERLALPRNLGYAGGMNAGLRALCTAGCDRVLLLNDDAWLEPGALRRLAEALADETLAAVGPVILREKDGRVESRGARFDPAWGRMRLIGHGETHEDAEGLVPVESLSGAAWMIRAAALARVGPLDESYFLSFEETDWCLRARQAGLGLAVVAGAVARHAGSLSQGKASPSRLYYAVRNHLRAAERHRPLAAVPRLGRGALIVALNLGHALRQHEAPRAASLRAVLAGVRDFRRGVSGPLRGGA
jgi:GT2 family glycosyltransferase/glycosyltransferase involved in cell wall biosynthesis